MHRSNDHRRAAALMLFVCAALCGCSGDGTDESAAPITSGAGGALGGAGGAGVTGGSSGAGGTAGSGMAGSGGMSAMAAGSGGQAGANAGTSAGMGSGGGGDTEPGDAGVGDDASAPEEGVTSELGVIVPTAEWACGLPMGIPAPSAGTLVVTIEADLEPVLDLGATQYGDRQIRLASGGDVSGEIEGSVIEGGYDWELTLPSGARELETRHVLRGSGGALAYMRGCGVGTPGGATRLVVVIEAGGSLAALQSGVYIATREVSEGHARYAIYRFAEDFAIDATAPAFAIERTAADRALELEPWACEPPPAGSSEGAQIIEATVGIGGSLAVGSTQNGSRNIIPITGGTFMGLGTSSALNGEVVPGGADFQLTPPGESFQLEARYTLRAEDGTLIAVRNCGGVGGTAPYFEAPLASPYAYLNDGDYFGRIGISIGAVIISVFERMD